jgi:hypothetical protein
MTPTEVLTEIQKMPLADRQRILEELSEPKIQAEPADAGAKEKNFVNGLKRKGLITETPLGLPDDEFRRRFERIEIRGEPISETIIKERG